MHYELYVDRLFFVQFIIHLLLIGLTAAVGRFKLARWRAVTSAAAGSFVFLAVFLWPLGSSVAAAVVKALLQSLGTLLMLQLAFGFDQASACVRAGMICGVCAFLVGGAMTALRVGTAQNVWQICFPSAALALAGALWMAGAQRCGNKNRYAVLLREGERSLRIQALMDSGNSLRDPVSGRPVCVVHKNVIESLGLRERPERFRAIPYHSVGKKHGLLNAWMVEEMWICMGGQKRRVCRVALAESGQLSETEDYQMLLHPALLEEEKGEKHDFESCDAGKDAV